MKKTNLILFLFIFILVGGVMAETTMNFLTKGFADRLYCRVNAACTLSMLTVDSLTVYNLSVIGEVFNVTMTRVSWNITDNFNVGGNLVAKNITSKCITLSDGTQFCNSYSAGIFENSTGVIKAKSSQDLNMQDGDISIKDTDGEFHNISRDLQLLDEMNRNTTLTGLNGSLASDGNLTITTTSGNNIVVNIDKTESILDRNTDSIIITSGTNESPILTQVIYVNAENPVLSTRTTLGLNAPGVATFLQGEDFTYVSAIGLATIDGLVGGLFNRFFRDGSTYRSGFDLNISTNEVNISTGVINFLFDEVEIIQNHSTNDLYVHIHTDGSFHQHTTLDQCSDYNDGSPVGNNKFYSIVFGMAITHDGEGVMYATTQDKPSTEYIRAIDAEVDLENTLNFFPPNDIVSLAYIPIARVVIRRSGGTNTIQTLSNGDLFDDLRGTVTKTSSSPPPSGITSYNDLTEIPWTNSGTNVILTDIGDNVGIGTTTPSSELHVIGTTNTTSLVTNNITCPDGTCEIDSNVNLGTKFIIVGDIRGLDSNPKLLLRDGDVGGFLSPSGGETDFDLGYVQFPLSNSFRNLFLLGNASINNILIDGTNDLIDINGNQVITSDNTTWVGNAVQNDTILRINGTTPLLNITENLTIGEATVRYNTDEISFATFDGDSGYFDIGEDESLNINGTEITLSAWVRTDDGSSGLHTIIGKWLSPQESYRLTLFANRSFFQLRDIGDNTFCNVVTSGTEINNSEWQHLVGIYNSSACAIFLNGVQLDTDTGLTANIRNQPTANVFIGAEQETTPIDFLDGDLDEVMIFNHSLTTQEVEALFNLGRDFGTYTGAESENLVAHYPMRGNAEDISQEDNNGIIFPTVTFTFTPLGIVFDESVFINDKLIVGNEINTAKLITTGLITGGGVTSLNANIIVQNRANAAAQLQLDAATGKVAQIQLIENGLINYVIRAIAGAGSDLHVLRYSDAGTVVDSPLVIDGATGRVNVLSLNVENNLGVSGTTTLSTVNIEDADLTIDGGSIINTNECGISSGKSVFESGNPVSNQGMSSGNGDILNGDPEGCSGVVTAIVGSCENCAGGTTIEMELRINGVSQTCDVPTLTSANDVDGANCNVAFSTHDVLGCWTKTEVGTVTGIRCTLYGRYIG